MDHLLTRRQTLQSLAYSTVFGGTILQLVGCGGGGHHGGSASSASANVAVQLPVGLTVPTTDLVGGTAYGTGALQNNAFKATVSSKGPTFAYLQQKSTGKFVLFGFAGQGQSGLSSMGSATAILATAFGIGGFDPDSARSLVTLIEASPATSTLAAVIESRVGADPFALTDGDAQVQAAVRAAIQSLTAGGSPLVRSQAGTRADPDPLISIQPQDQGGCSVEQGTAAATIVPTNKVRRPAAAYTYLTGYTDDGGTTTTLPTVQAFGSEEDLAPTTGFLASLASLGTRPANAPVSGTPLRLTIHSGTNTLKTTYETVILMASQSQAGEPSFFADPKYAGVVDAWRTKRKDLNAHAWIGTILRDTFASVAGGASTWISASTAVALVAKIEAVGAAAEQAVIDVESGKFLSGTYTWLSQAVSEGDIGIATRKAIANIVLEAEGAGETAVSAELLTAIGAVAAVVVGTLAAAGTIIGAGDLGAGWIDLATSDIADVWSISLLKPNVAISPSSAKVYKGGSLVLTAATPGVSETNYKFHWTLSSGGNGNIGDPSGTGGVGRDVTTAGTTINLLTSASDGDGTVYSITVTAIDLKTGAALGTAKATVTISAEDQGQIVSVFTKSGASPSGGHFAWAFVPFQPVPGKQFYSALGIKEDGTQVGPGYVSTDAFPYLLPDGTTLTDCVCVYGSPGAAGTPPNGDSTFATADQATYYLNQFIQVVSGATYHVYAH